ncbi:MAG: M48 family metallopeptidase [Akkermansiaceae bacterium]|nr:M48 family metallopeptidase [Akkermansiaceae bacterium]
MTHYHLILLSLVALGFQSCTFRPAIDDQGVVTVRNPNKMMRNHGFSEFEKIKRTRAISQDPRHIQAVARVANRLKKVIEMPDAEWEFVIFKDNSPNAFALPGGKVGINTGLFQLIGHGPQGDALLAAVLGHEISHATANHAQQRMYRGVALGVLASILWCSLEHNDVDHPQYTVAAFATAYYLVDSLPFSRKQEYESDKIGAVYMAKAGYDPRVSIELWRRLLSYHTRRGGQKPEFLRTHPLDNARIRALEVFMPTALRYYSKHRASR